MTRTMPTLVLALALVPIAANAHWPADPAHFVTLSPGGTHTVKEALCPDGLGGALVLWSLRYGVDGLVLQRVDAHGVAVYPDAHRFEAGAFARGLAGDGAGGGAVLEERFADADSQHVLTLHSIGPSGDGRWQRVLWNGPYPGWGDWGHVEYVPASRAWLVTWLDGSVTPSPLRAQLVGEDGTVRWSPGGIVAVATSVPMRPRRFAVDPSGGAWLGYTLETDPPSAWVQHVDPDGVARFPGAGAWVGEAPDLWGIRSLGASADGSAWLSSYTYPNGGDRLQRVRADGSLAFGPTGLRLPGSFAEQRLDAWIAPAGTEHAWVCWTGGTDLDGWVSEAQAIDSSGAWVGLTVRLGDHGYGEYRDGRAYVNDDGGATFAFGPTSYEFVSMVTRLAADGSPTWSSSTPAFRIPPAMGSGVEESYEMDVPPIPDGRGGLIAIFTLHDSTNTSDVDAVRVQRVDAWGRHGDLPPLQVAPPAAPSTDLLSIAPSPMVQAARVRFGLARPGVVTLELFDLAGRRVRALAHGTFEGGEHTITLARERGGERLLPGLYRLRLSTSTATRSVPLVVLD